MKLVLLISGIQQAKRVSVFLSIDMLYVYPFCKEGDFEKEDNCVDKEIKFF